MKLVEDVVPESYHKEISSVLTSVNFPWYFIPKSVPETENTDFVVDENTKDSGLFTHAFMNNGVITSNYFPLVRPILYFLEYKTDFKYQYIDRIKANFMVKDSEFPENFYNAAHSDVVTVDDEYKTFLYYVNDSDGDTVLFNEVMLPFLRPNSLTVNKRQTPKQNCGVIFSSNQMHASTPPRVADYRININFILK